MTVFDASVLVDALVVDAAAGDAARQALHDRTELAVPALFTAEATSAVRRLALAAEISDGRARSARRAIAVLRTTSYPFEPFIERVWELRHSMNVYDGWYVALAESLATTLVTADGPLARSSGARCPIVEVAQFVAAGGGRPPVA